MKGCLGCQEEMEFCYICQEQGLDAGLDWDSEGRHCFVFAFDKKGKVAVC